MWWPWFKCKGAFRRSFVLYRGGGCAREVLMLMKGIEGGDQTPGPWLSARRRLQEVKARSIQTWHRLYFTWETQSFKKQWLIYQLICLWFLLYVKGGNYNPDDLLFFTRKRSPTTAQLEPRYLSWFSLPPPAPFFLSRGEREKEGGYRNTQRFSPT